MAKNKTSSIVWLRRLTQTIFLLLFLYLFLATTYHPENTSGGPITLFFDFDPLVMLTIWLGGHVLASALLLSLFTLFFTLIFGRWFCGWICPFGALHNLLTAMRGTSKKDRIRIDGYSIWQKSKYYILVVILVGAFFGANMAGWLDPFSFFFRALAMAIFPLINAGLQGLFNWTYEVNPIGLSAISEPVYQVLRQYFLAFEQPHYLWGMLFGVLFGIVIALNFLRARFWCRYICPLGALLGLFGKNPVVRLNIDTDKCNDCLACVIDCQGGADPQSLKSWKPSECFFCWNCDSGCPTDAISFQFKVPGGDRPRKNSIVPWTVNFFKPTEDSGLDLGRRRVLAAGIVGLGGGLLFNAHPLAGRDNFSPELIRPPGATPEDEFLDKCIRCGECMKVCPTNVIQPSMLEAGLEGIWSPVLKMDMSYCEYKCSMCTQVCPTEAIKPLTLEEKQEVRIGLAHIDKNRCLPYAYARPCLVCQEHCPLPDKAIWLEETTVLNARGNEVVVKQPHVNAELCIGCGICQDKCPVSDQAAILVTSVGETRNIKNEFRTADRYSG